jgi:uncharacterized membrane protein
MKSVKIATIIALAALSIGTNYAMISLYNIKLMDLIVFVSGFCFGPLVGVLTAVVSWATYGTFNPYGFSLPIWMSTMLMESVYGLAGSAVRRELSSNEWHEPEGDGIGGYFFFGMLGMLLTLVYDFVTNLVFGAVSGWSILFAVVVGFFPFGLLHMVSNAFFFGIACIPTVKAVIKITGGENSGNPKK